MNKYYCREIREVTAFEIPEMDILYLTSCGDVAEALLKQGAAVLAALPTEELQEQQVQQEWLQEQQQVQQQEQRQEQQQVQQQEQQQERQEQQKDSFGTQESARQNLERLRSVPYACESLEDLDRDYYEMIFRRYRNIPWDILQTARLNIRETTVEDVDAFWEIYKDPEITRYTEGLYPTIEQEREYQQDYIEKIYKFYGVGIWTLEDRETSEIIGRAGLSYRTFGDDYEYGECPELGFVVATPYQRQGYAKEACSAIIQWARDNLECPGVTALVRPENEASLKLCRELRMVERGNVKIEDVPHIIMFISFD